MSGRLCQQLQQTLTVLHSDTVRCAKNSALPGHPRFEALTSRGLRNIFHCVFGTCLLRQDTEHYLMLRQREKRLGPTICERKPVSPAKSNGADSSTMVIATSAFALYKTLGRIYSHPASSSTYQHGRSKQFVASKSHHCTRTQVW